MGYGKPDRLFASFKMYLRVSATIFYALKYCTIIQTRRVSDSVQNPASLMTCKYRQEIDINIYKIIMREVNVL